MRSNTVYKAAYNRCLDYFSQLKTGAPLPSLSQLAAELAVSRTTARSVLAAMAREGIVGPDGEGLRFQRKPGRHDYFPEGQTMSAGATVERRFMEWILQGDIRAGQLLNSAELARQLGTSTTTIREYLTHFQHFGLIERRPNSAWVFLGVTRRFAEEVFEVRAMFEQRSALHFITKPDNSRYWAELGALDALHRELMADVENRYREFPALDERLHRLIHDASENRYIVEFYSVVSAIFHYTYQWNREDELQRSTRAMTEHLDYIAALQEKNPQTIEKAINTHLGSARKTLLRSIDLGSFR